MDKFFDENFTTIDKLHLRVRWHKLWWLLVIITNLVHTYWVELAHLALEWTVFFFFISWIQPRHSWLSKRKTNDNERSKIIAGTFKQLQYFVCFVLSLIFLNIYESSLLDIDFGVFFCKWCLFVYPLVIYAYLRTNTNMHQATLYDSPLVVFPVQFLHVSC